MPKTIVQDEASFVSKWRIEQAQLRKEEERIRQEEERIRQEEERIKQEEERIKQEERNQRMDYTFEEIDKMTGVQFENFVKNILQKNEYENPQITKASGDEGVDIITYKNGEKIAVQCKEHAGKISNSAIAGSFFRQAFL